MKTLFIILGVLFGILSVVGGIAVGFGIFAYGIYSIILMCKGTLAVTFWGILKVILCWALAAFAGWLTFFVFAFLSAMCAAASD